MESTLLIRYRTPELNLASLNLKFSNRQKHFLDQKFLIKYVK